MHDVTSKLSLLSVDTEVYVAFRSQHSLGDCTGRDSAVVVRALAESAPA